MRLKMLILVLTVFMLCSISTYASDYDIVDIKLNNVEVPDEFGVCTLDSCDDEFKKTLKTYNHTYDDWVEKIMKPDNIYFYASTQKSENIYIRCADIYGEETDTEPKNRYVYDFNLAREKKTQSRLMDEYKSNLVGQGVSEGSIEMNYIPAGENIPTCYITSKYRTGELWIYEFYTVYAGKEWTFSMSSPEGLYEESYRILDNLVFGLEYDYEVDYSDAEISFRQKDENEDDKTKYSESKNGRLVFLVTTITIVFLAIYIITEKQRKKF